MKNKVINKIKSIPIYVWIIVIISLFLMSFIIEGFVSWGHDLNFHIGGLLANNHSIDISNFHFFPTKIFGANIANGFGYGAGIFYPSLSHWATGYVSIITGFLFGQTVFAITIVELLIMILSGITMYMFMNRVFKDKKVSFLSAISYICATYFINNLYARCALAEAFTFIFIPLVFLGLYELFFGNKNRFYVFFILGYVGMIYSHLVITLYLTLFILILFLCYYKKFFKIDILKKLIMSSIIILLFTSPFWLPMLEHKLFGNYVVFQESSMVYWADLRSAGLSIREMFEMKGIEKFGFANLYINFMVVILSIVTIIFNKKIFKKNREIFNAIMIFFLLSLWLTSKYFPWNQMPSILKMIQFPWRMETFLIFAMAILSGLSLKIYKGDTKILATVFSTAIIVIIGYMSISTSVIRQAPNQSIIYKLGMGMGGQWEYLPVKLKDNSSYLSERDKSIIFKKGKGTVEVNSNDAPYYKGEIILNSKGATIELPRIFYYGYQITITDEDGKKEQIKYYENEKGFIETKIKNGGIIEIKYKGTFLNKMAKLFFVFTLFISLYWLLKNRKKLSC